MKKNIIITAGPTNERIDAVMKITNMSTGTLGSIIAETILEQKGEEIGKIYFLSPKLCNKPKIEGPQIELITIDSAVELLEELEDLLKNQKIDLVIHSAAVGDYTGKYVIRAEDLIKEILIKQEEKKQDKITEEDLLSIFENPKTICNAETKISSYEPHLMTMLTLTPKVIGRIKQINPAVKLVGFKLLEGVSKEKLYEVAHRLLLKNQADYIVANDLAKIGGGKHWAIIIDKDGIQRECNTKKEIAQELINLVF